MNLQRQGISLQETLKEMQPIDSAEPEKARPLGRIKQRTGNTPATLPRVGKEGFLRKVIPTEKSSHTRQENCLILQRLKPTNATQ